MVKLNKIYTRTGDTGTTGLVDGSRVPKSSALIAAIGEVDEANSAIGLAVLHADGDTHAALRRIQSDLFDLGADLATPGSMGAAIDGALRIVPPQVARLETEIDTMTAALQPLTSFVLPGGTPLGAALHLARAITRRAERAAVAVQPVPAAPALAYLNRLSDWLFCAARIANDSGDSDILWQPGATR
jgi:cob(I)alamin adenosyltransferase